jgi:hypothetical protein
MTDASRGRSDGPFLAVMSTARPARATAAACSASTGAAKRSTHSMLTPASAATSSTDRPARNRPWISRGVRALTTPLRPAPADGAGSGARAASMRSSSLGSRLRV